MYSPVNRVFSFTSVVSQEKAINPLKVNKEFTLSDSFDFEIEPNWYTSLTKGNNIGLSKDKSGRFKDGYVVSQMNYIGQESSPKRGEISIRLYAPIGTVKYYSLSVQIPESFVLDQNNLGRETLIFQWHSRPAPGKTWDDYRVELQFNRPSVAVFLTTNDNKNFYLVLRYGNNGKKGFDAEGHFWSIVGLSKIELSKWYDFTFEIKWSDKNDGFVAAWLNNEPFTPFNGYSNRVFGANMHNVSPVYFKFGQYRYWDDTHSLDVYYDEFRVGNSLKEVLLKDELPEMFNAMKEVNFVKNHQ